MSGDKIEELIQNYLVKKNIYPFSVIYIPSHNLLKMSFYLDSDIEDILTGIDYEHLCDRTGIVVIKETNTVLFSDIGLNRFIDYVTNN